MDTNYPSKRFYITLVLFSKSVGFSLAGCLVSRAKREYFLHVNETLTISETHISTVKGLNDNEIVNVHRETGCSRVVIKRNLVKFEQKTGKNQTCIFADV